MADVATSGGKKIRRLPKEDGWVKQGNPHTPVTGSEVILDGAHTPSNRISQGPVFLVQIFTAPNGFLANYTLRRLGCKAYYGSDVRSI